MDEEEFVIRVREEVVTWVRGANPVTVRWFDVHRKGASKPDKVCASREVARAYIDGYGAGFKDGVVAEHLAATADEG